MNLISFKEAHTLVTTSPAKLAEILTALASTGSPVDLSVADSSLDDGRVEINQAGDLHASQAFELEDGHIAYMIDLRIINHRTRTIDVLDIELRPPWREDFLHWVTPITIKPKRPSKRDRGRRVYRFPGHYGPEFAYEDVLNHRLVEGGTLPGQRLLAGYLLATGGPMPPHFRHGQWVKVDVVLTTGDYHEYLRTLRLYVDRLDRPARIVKPRIPIFANSVRDADASRRNDATVPTGARAVSSPRPTASPTAESLQDRGKLGFQHDMADQRSTITTKEESETMSDSDLAAKWQAAVADFLNRHPPNVRK